MTNDFLFVTGKWKHHPTIISVFSVSGLRSQKTAGQLKWPLFRAGKMPDWWTDCQCELWCFYVLAGCLYDFSEVLNSWTVLAYCEAKITVCCIVFGNELKPSVAVKRSYAINFLRSHWLASWHTSTKTVTCPRPGNMTLTRFSGIKKKIISSESCCDLYSTLIL